MATKFHIFDIEADELLDKATKVHCLSYQTYLNGEIIDKNTFIKKESIKNFFKKDGYFVGHRIINYDLPVIRKLLFDVSVKKIDTLGLSLFYILIHLL